MISGLEPIDNRFKLRRACRIDLYNNTLAIGDSFYVGFDEGLRDFVVAGTWFYGVCWLEEGASSACALEWGYLFFEGLFLFFEVLSGAQWAHCFGNLVDFPFGLCYKCH